MMTPCTLQEVVTWTEGTLRQGSLAAPVQRLHTDSRAVQTGDCFVALRGDRFDGHHYVLQARGAGAVAALVAQDWSTPVPSDFGLVQVEDTLMGLQRFAAAYRKRLSLRVVGVTGSSGKTTTKEMIASVLRQKFSTQATQGNLNNHIGVPLTLLRLGPEVEAAVIEMGMNHPGEIASLTKMSAPEIGVITNIGLAHIEFFPDQRGIADEKAELIRALPPTGVAILNADDPMTARVRQRTSARVVLAGLAASAEWRAEQVQMTTDGLHFLLRHGSESIAIQLPLFSRVLVTNALMAAAVGGEYGLTMAEIKRGLESVVLPGQRMEVRRIGSGWLINDAYNANPDSMKAALEALREFPAPGRRLAVLGSMGELGAQAVGLHEEVGRLAAAAGLDGLITVGPQRETLQKAARAGGLSLVVAVEDAAGASEALAQIRQPNDCILIKGSRFMKLEQVVQTLTQAEGA